MATPKTVVVTGGGSGGHITPILAVARELKRLAPETRVVYIGQKGDGLDDVVAADKHIDEMHAVYAGKLRRYHGEGLRQILDLRTTYLNLRDSLLVWIGIVQSFILLKHIKPEVIFTRGSYVSVPVCLSAAALRIKYVTHDSDAIPSLTNRIIARWASLHAVALPEELYEYPIDKTTSVGVPISPDYQLVTDELRRRYRRETELEKYDWIILVTGGGLGAKRLNEAVIANSRALLEKYPGLAIVHVTGRMHEQPVAKAYDEALTDISRYRVMVKGFVHDMYRYSGGANIVIARGGATNLAELAVQAKPCIIVPNPLLTGGHQIKNAEALKDAGAIIEMTEEQIDQELRLASVVSDLLDHPAKMNELSRRLRTFARPDAAERLAKILYMMAGGGHAENVLERRTDGQDGTVQ